MSDQRTYISVMTPAASDGTLTFLFDTFDAEENISLVATVTGVDADTPCIDLAIAIQTQLEDQLPAYSGSPVFSDGAYQATFRVTRTAHCVCLWSQAQFRVQLTDDDTGTTLKISGTPVLMTLARAVALNSSFSGGSFAAFNGATLSDDQIIDLLEATSAELISYLNNNIVISTYLGEWRTDGYKSVFTSPTPGLSIDLPVVRRKYFYELYAIPRYGTFAFNWIRHTGQLNFRYSENFVNAGEPFELDNEVRVTFTAGLYDVPVAVERCLLQLAQLALNASAGVQELAGGSFRVKFKAFNETLQALFRPVRPFIAKKMR